MPDSVSPPAGLPELETFIDALSAKLPGAFFIPASLRPPTATRPHSDRDWVLLPAGMHLSARNGLLQNTYRWFESDVALFIGATTEADFRLFEPNASGRPGHKLWWDGSRWALDTTNSLAGEPINAIVEFLAPRLPVVSDADAMTEKTWASVYHGARGQAPIRIFVRGALTTAQRLALVALAHRHPRQVSLRIRLHKGLTTARGLLELRELVRADPPLDLTIFAENPLFAASADVLTRTLVRSRQNCRGVCAASA